MIQKAVHDYKKENLTKNLRKERIFIENTENKKKKKIIKTEEIKIPLVHGNKTLPKNFNHLHL